MASSSSSSSVALVLAAAAIQIVAAAATDSCPLNFQVLDDFECDPSRNSCGSCSDGWNRLNFVVAEYVRRTQVFLLPAHNASACIEAFQAELQAVGLDANFTSACGIGPSVLAEPPPRGGCPDVRTVQDFRSSVDEAALQQVDSTCSSYSTLPGCGRCFSSATAVSSTAGQSCLNFSFVYAAGVASQTGPLDPWVAFCFFYLKSLDGEDQHRRRMTIIVLSTLVPAGVVLVVVSVAGLWFFRRRRRLVRLRDSEHNSDRRLKMMHGAVEFTIEELRLATGGFSARNKIGSGGFSNVFKGTLQDGTAVAVKRLKNCSPAGDPEFVHEVEVIGGVRHRNLVGLLGWCVSSNSSEARHHERFIVYEFMRNGSLQDRLSAAPGKSSAVRDSWQVRKAIIVGVARGLAYLHRGAVPGIIHRDVKSSNILLDEDMNPRISDMGLAKFVPEGVSSFHTGAVGTHGYVAPEYVLYQQLTEKNDVYAFGIVMLEVLTGNKALVPPSSTPIADWAWDFVKEEKVAELLLSGAGPAEQQCLEEMLRFLVVAFLCAHPYVDRRPSMPQALRMLEDGTGVPAVFPERPAGFAADSPSSSAGTQVFSLSPISSRE